MFKKPPIIQYAIHHTAVSRSSQSNQLLPVNRYHQEKWGMKSTLGWYVGYNYFIDVDGTTTNTRAVGEETIANIRHNCDVYHRCDTISICLAGDFNKELPTDKQVTALRKLIDSFRSTCPLITGVFHRDIQDNRTCPGLLYTDEYHTRVILEHPYQPDLEDAKKARTIAELSRTLDYLRSLLRKLQKKD